jgi:hypothetical protein
MAIITAREAYIAHCKEQGRNNPTIMKIMDKIEELRYSKPEINWSVSYKCTPNIDPDVYHAFGRQEEQIMKALGYELTWGNNFVEISWNLHNKI